jgi:hypothetical protein
VAHCAGGPGPASADYIGALEAWVEQKSANDALSLSLMGLPL